MLPGTNRTIEAPLCKASDECYQAANLEFLNSSSVRDESCSDCKQACASIDFSLTPSSVLAPNFLLASSIKNLVEEQGFPLPDNWTTDWETEVKNNYVGLEVVCQSPLVENITQHPLIRVVDVLSSVGGQAGLWIGISFLSIVELIEMLYHLVRHQFHTISTNTARRVAPNSQ